MRLRTCLVLVLLCLSACVGGPKHTSKSGDRALFAPLVEDLAILATGKPPTPRVLQEIQAADSTSLDRYIDALLAEKTFAEEVLPGMLYYDADPLFPYKLLDQFSLPGTNETIYFLYKPCSANDSVLVRPWWDQRSKVRVCRDSFRPEVRMTAKGGACIGVLADPQVDSDCGCGPDLAYCLTGEQAGLAVDAFQGELRATLLRNVSEERPFATLFTDNATVRGRLAEAVYQTWRIGTGEIDTMPDLTDWPAHPVYAPRHESRPGEHAGILTTPRVLFRADAPRALVRDVSAILLCSKPESSGVEASTMLALGTTNLRAGDGWQKLAAMPSCTGCHARLDYGSQFFKGYPGWREALGFDGSRYAPDAVSTLYINDINDPRAEGPASPLGFVTLAMKQPEYRDCIARTFATYVLGPTTSGEDMAALKEILGHDGSARDLMRESLKRYANRYASARALAHEQLTLDDADPRRGGVEVGPILRTHLNKHCSSCHSEGDMSFSTDSLEPKTAEKMLSELAFSRMPPDDQSMAPPARRAMIESLIGTISSSIPERGRPTGLRVHAPNAIRELIWEVAGNSPGGPTWRVSHPRVVSEPLVVRAGFEALAACRTRAPADKDACLTKALAPQHLLADPYKGN